MKKLLSLFLAVTTTLLCADVLEVDYSKQKKEAFPDFASALNAAKEGDTIKLLKVDFTIYDNIAIKNRSGITVDGSFNTMCGLEKADKKNWKQVSPGLWKRDIMLNKGVSMRYFMVIDGKQQRMGRYFKAPCRTKYKKVEELREKEWTIIENRGKGDKREQLYSIFLKLDKSITDISKADIREPRPSKLNGVDISGKCRNIVIKNFICRNFWNDGYNIHKDCRNITFDTICALDCGDDGISAHETCEIKVKNLVAIGCSTGICHIQQVTASHTNCYITESLGKDIYFKAEKSNRLSNTLKNVFVNCNSAGGVCLGTIKRDKLVIDKLVVVLSGEKGSFNFTPAAGAEIKTTNISVRRTEPRNMKEFKKNIFAKFSGTLEKELTRR